MKPDGVKPVFQVPYWPDADVKTLRDEFAMAAMQGMLSNCEVAVCSEADFAKFAYEQADAMMAERAKR